jgi:hypothetical protein
MLNYDGSGQVSEADFLSTLTKCAFSIKTTRCLDKVYLFMPNHNYFFIRFLRQITLDGNKV